jgi:hypothetical protein
MNAQSSAVSMKKRMESDRKIAIALLAIGILFVISGIIMAFCHVSPMISVFTMGLGGVMIAPYIYSRGGTLIRDEMWKRTDEVSGNYAYGLTLWFLCLLGITSYFHPLQWSFTEFLLIMMIFMSYTKILIRFILMRRGKAE